MLDVFAAAIQLPAATARGDFSELIVRFPKIVVIERIKAGKDAQKYYVDYCENCIAIFFKHSIKYKNHVRCSRGGLENKISIWRRRRRICRFHRIICMNRRDAWK
jgi:hypothetical protein